MTEKKANEKKRKNERYETEIDVYFHFPYELQTKLDYQVTDDTHTQPVSPRYSGISKNVSAEGLCFNSKTILSKGDYLLIDLHLPGDNTNVMMEGMVRWCQAGKRQKGYDTGVQLITVNGESIKESIYFDETYQVEWSALLESVLGKFRIISQNRKT